MKEIRESDDMRGALVLKVIAYILMTVAGVLLAWEIYASYGQQIKDALPYGFYVFVTSLIVVGILLERYADKRQGKEEKIDLGVGKGYK